MVLLCCTSVSTMLTYTMGSLRKPTHRYTALLFSSNSMLERVKVVYRGCFPKSLVRVFCEETWRFASQSGPRVLAKMAWPARVPTLVGLAVAPEARAAYGTYRRAARQVAARPRRRRAEPSMSPKRLQTESCASGARRSQRGAGRLGNGRRRGVSMLRTCAARSGVLLYAHGRYAMSCGFCMCSKSMCPSNVLKASAREDCARLEGCVGACERFQKSF